LAFEIEWQNKGVAPAYNSYKLNGRLIPVNENSESIDFEIEDSGNKNWMPDEIVNEKYRVSLPKKPKGEYMFAIQLFDKTSETPVEIGLSTEIKYDGYFIIQEITF
jgi:hypothetical protein